MSEINTTTRAENGRPTREEAFSQMRFEQHRQGITHAVRAESGLVCPWCNGKYDEFVKKGSI